VVNYINGVGRRAGEAVRDYIYISLCYPDSSVQPASGNYQEARQKVGSRIMPRVTITAGTSANAPE
jgi:hypothetical protein